SGGDEGYQGAGACIVFTPYKRRDKPESCKQANRSHATLRGPGERANAQLRAGGSSAGSAAAPARPTTSSRPSRPTELRVHPSDEKASVIPCRRWLWGSGVGVVGVV